MNFKARKISGASKSAGLTSASALAADRYAELGVDTTAATRALAGIPISVHCWQGDDVRGFEETGSSLGGGLAVTGEYLGRARNSAELRQDLEKAFTLIPGRHRVNLHASYGEFGGTRVDRDDIAPEHFAGWIAWAKSQRLGLDFNPTFFSHPKAGDGFTLAHQNSDIRKFWIQHGLRCREIGTAMGRALGTPCVTNFWIPDGYKDTPVDRHGPRGRLLDSLDSIFRKKLPEQQILDAVEPKLFGIGSESYVAGSHEFYLGYAITRKKLLCLDAGHFHPTESIADKISSVLEFLPRILLHLSRGVRWDSDHVVTFGDDLLAITREVVAGGLLQRVHLGLDYFDASINRIAAWVIGVRNVQRALLAALLQPWEKLRAAEREGNFTERLALQEEIKGLPFGAIWDQFCLEQNVPVGIKWLAEVQRYERDILAARG